MTEEQINKLRNLEDLIRWCDGFESIVTTCLLQICERCTKTFTIDIKKDTLELKKKILDRIQSEKETFKNKINQL